MNNEANKINFQEFFTNLLDNLSQREQEVLKKRYQLISELNDKSTLKQIGDDYGITRERVRQIEKEAISKLAGQANQAPYSQSLSQLKNSLLTYLSKKGGLVNQDHLIKEHALALYDFDYLHLNAFLFILDHMIDEVDKKNDSDENYGFWFVKDLQHDKVEEIVSGIVNILEEKKQVVLEKELFEIITNKIINDAHKQLMDQYIANYQDVNYSDVVASILAVTKKVEKNILNGWGLSHWPQIRPKKLADKIYLIFEKSTKPLHFRDVAENINNAGFDRKKICAATVHNELIANENYVLIGRGIYALKTWGYTAGTVSDVVASILKTKQQPMSKEDIYQEVLKQRKVNPSTIYLSLINKNKFNKLSNGLFELK